ncbi:hypothetical protein SCLCIDRAFT_59433, partial [Scleroderma citrinum Foug A]
NHSNIVDHLVDIRAYILDELRLGRFSGPFSASELSRKIGPFRSSPFQIVAKPGLKGTPPKIRVCRNLSYKGPSGRSVNDEIDSDDFPTRWGSAELTAMVIARAPPGSQAASLDIEAAYRGITISPDHKRFLVVMFEDLLYLDHTLPLGLTSASGLQGEVSDAIVDIWNALNVGPMLKWVDDFVIFRSP